MKTFLERPIEGDWPYIWIDATYLKVRRGGRIVSVAVIIAVGVNSDGRRERRGPWKKSLIRRPLFLSNLDSHPTNPAERGLRGHVLALGIDGWSAGRMLVPATLHLIAGEEEERHSMRGGKRYHSPSESRLCASTA